MSIPLFLSRSPSDRWLLLALLAVFSIIYAQYALKIQHGDGNARSAFLRWRTQLGELDDGVNVWQKHAYPNPPIMALLLKPFLDLPPTLGASLWFACKATLALFAILGVWSLIELPSWAKVIAVLPTLRPIEGDLVHGNVNVLILFLIVMALLAFCRRRDGLAGFLLGLSIACKLTPALFLAYFLYKRAWTALAGATIGLIVFVLIVPGAYFGWQNNLDYLASWHEQMVAPYAAGVVTSEHKNQSLPGLLHRLLCDEPSFSDYDGDRKVVLENHNLAAWDRGVVQAIVLAAMLIFTVLAMRFCRTPLVERPPLQLMAEFSVVVLGMLLFCERTWKHHCVTLLLPFTVLAIGIASFSRPLRIYCGATLGTAALLMLSTSTGFGLDRVGKLAQVYGAYPLAFFLLLAGMFVVLRKTNLQEPVPQEPA